MTRLKQLLRVQDALNDIIHDGSAKSGHWGHVGRPGYHGGSAPSGMRQFTNTTFLNRHLEKDDVISANDRDAQDGVSRIIQKLGTGAKKYLEETYGIPKDRIDEMHRMREVAKPLSKEVNILAERGTASYDYKIPIDGYNYCAGSHNGVFGGIKKKYAEKVINHANNLTLEWEKEVLKDALLEIDNDIVPNIRKIIKTFNQSYSTRREYQNIEHEDAVILSEFLKENSTEKEQVAYFRNFYRDLIKDIHKKHVAGISLTDEETRAYTKEATKIDTLINTLPVFGMVAYREKIDEYQDTLKHMHIELGRGYAERFVEGDKGYNVYDMVAANMVHTLDAYTSSQHNEIRHGQSDDRRKQRELLDDFIYSMPKYEGAIYRGRRLSGDKFTELMDNLKKGNTIGMGGPSSWSTSKSVAEDFSQHSYSDTNDVRIMFVLPGNKSGASVKFSAYHENENEVVQPSTGRFKLKKGGEYGDGYTTHENKVNFNQDVPEEVYVIYLEEVNYVE